MVELKCLTIPLTAAGVACDLSGPEAEVRAWLSLSSPFGTYVSRFGDVMHTDLRSFNSVYIYTLSHHCSSSEAFHTVRQIS